MNINEFIKRNKYTVIIIILGLIFIGSGFFLSLKQNNNKESNSVKDDPTRQVFFFTGLEDNGKSALFDFNGNMIFDFIFDYTSEFYNGLSTVEVDGKYGIINDKGEYVVPLGKYDTINGYKDFIIVEDENDEFYILKQDLKTKISIGKYKHPYVYFGVNGYVLIITDNEIKIINKLGNVVKELEIEDTGEDFNIHDLDYSRSSYNFAIIIYKDKMIIIDNNTYEILYDGASNGLKHASSFNDKGIILTSDYSKHFVLYNKQLIPVECDSVEDPETNIRVCKKDEEKYILEDDGTYTQRYIHTNSEYIDRYHYALEYFKEEKVEIYSDGNLVKTIDDAWLSFKGNQSYTIKYNNIRSKDNDARMSLIDKDGNFITKEIYDYVSPLDKNSHYIIKDDDGLEYLMNLEGEKISKGYYKINLDELAKHNHYKVYDNDNYSGFLDSTGKEVIPIMFKMSDDQIAYCDENEIIVGGETKDNKNIIYSSKYKELLNIDKPISYMYLFNSFASIEEDKGSVDVTFYTMHGKQFYQKKGITF